GRERRALPLELRTQGAEPLLGGAHRTREASLLEVVLAHERRLGADLLVERVEARARGRGRRRRPPEHGLRLGDTAREALRLGERVGDCRLRERRPHARQFGLLREQREALIGERVEGAQAVLYLLEAEGDAPGLVDGIRALRLLD